MEPMDDPTQDSLSGQDPDQTSLFPTLEKVKPLPPDPVSVGTYRKFTLSDLREPDIKLTMKQLFKWAVDRLKEGSSWAGIGMIAAAVGISQELAAEVISTLVAVSGLVSVFLKDKAEKEAEDNG